MQLPNVKHPKPVILNGATFDVCTYIPITDEQAMKIAIFYVRSSPKKFKKGKRYQLHFNLDQHNAGII